MPSDVEIARSMMMREAENVASRILGFDVNSSPMSKMVFHKMVEKAEPYIEAYLGPLLSEPPHSIDAGKEIIKEDIASGVDSFAEKMKQRLEANKQT